ncbi:MAG: hypothetical protein QOG94_1767, partial [Solirubrobacteraceae bacterium]|nr:hypothetical protein [Solirubrobacteraceae bacterium]
MLRRPGTIARHAAVATAIGACATVAAIVPAPASGDLSGRVSSLQAKERAARAASRYDSRRISHFRGPIADLQARERGLQRSLDIQRQILGTLRFDLRTDRARLMRLRRGLAHDKL